MCHPTNYLLSYLLIILSFSAIAQNDQQGNTLYLTSKEVSEEIFRYGCINENGKEVLAPEFTLLTNDPEVSKYQSGFENVLGKSAFNLFPQVIQQKPVPFFKENEVQFLNNKGTVTGTIDFSEYELVLAVDPFAKKSRFLEIYNENLQHDLHRFAVGPDRENLKYGLYASDGSEVLPPQYQYITPFINDRAIVVTSDTTYRYVDLEGAFLFEKSMTIKDARYMQVFPSLFAFSNGLAAKMDGKKNHFGFINEQGKEVIPVEHQELMLPFNKDGNALFSGYDNNPFWVNKAGEVKEPEKFRLVGRGLNDEGGMHSEYLFKIQGNSRLGLMNFKGQIRIEPKKYVQLAPNDDNTITARTMDHDYLITKHGTELARLDTVSFQPAGHNTLEAWSNTPDLFQEYTDWFPAKTKAKRGIVDEDGEVVHQFSHDQVKDGGIGLFLHNQIPPGGKELLQVKKDNKWGYMNLDYEWVIDPVYDKVTPFKNGRAWVVKDSMLQLISRKEKVMYEQKAVKKPHGYGEQPRSGLVNTMQVETTEKRENQEEKYEQSMRKNLDEYAFHGDFCKIKKDGKFGLIGPNGTTAVPAEQHRVDHLGDGMFSIRGPKGHMAFGPYGKVDFENGYLMNAMSESCANGLCAYVSNESFKMGYMNYGGKIVIEPQYDNVENFVDGKAWVKKGDSYLRINKKGEVLSKHSFDKLLSDRSPFIVRSQEMNHAAIGEDGQVIVSFGEYESLHYNSTDGIGGYQINSTSSAYYTASDNYLVGETPKEKYYLLDPTGKKVTSEPYEYIERISKDHFVVGSVQKQGVMDKNGKLIIPAKFQKIQHLGDQFIAYKEGKFGILNLDGTFIPANRYKLLANLSDNEILVEWPAQMGIMDTTLTWRIPPQYDQVSPIIGGTAVGQVNVDYEHYDDASVAYVINSDGEELFHHTDKKVFPTHGPLTLVMEEVDYEMQIMYANEKGEIIWKSEMTE